MLSEGRLWDHLDEKGHSMTAIIWGELDQRRYENGVDRGVIYPEDDPAVVWNGLINVAEHFIGGAKTEHFFDGVKYADITSVKNFQATVSAYSFPAVMNDCLGERPLRPGVFLAKQLRTSFSMSYRTLVNPGDHYKLHMVWNATIARSAEAHSTIASDTSPTTFSWRLDATPPPSDFARPTPHMFIDSSKADSDVLADLETLLYGTGTVDPIFPTQQEVYEMFNN